MRFKDKMLPCPAAWNAIMRRHVVTSSQGSPAASNPTGCREPYVNKRQTIMSDSEHSERSVDISDFSEQSDAEDDQENEEMDQVLQSRNVMPYRFEPYDSDSDEVEVSDADHPDSEANGGAAPCQDLDIGRLQNTEWCVILLANCL